MAQPKRVPVDLDARRHRSPRRTLAPVVTEGPLIKQRDLQEVVTLRQEVETLAKELHEAKRLADEAEVPIRLALSMQGVHVEPGPFVASVATDSRRSPAWKEEFIARCGPAAAEAVLANTKPKITQKLVISETSPAA